MGKTTELTWIHASCDSDAIAEEADFEWLCREAKTAWSQHFSPRRGYTLLTSNLPGRGQRVRLSALRGDFRADLDLVLMEACSDDGRRALKVSSHVSSMRLAEAEEKALAWSRPFGDFRHRMSQLMFALGIGCLLFSGTIPYLFIVGIFSLCVGSFLGRMGTWREHVAEHLRGQVWSMVLSDMGTQRDLRRWRAAGQRIHSRRNDLQGREMQAPFRRPALAP